MITPTNTSFYTIDEGQVPRFKPPEYQKHDIRTLRHYTLPIKNKNKKENLREDIFTFLPKKKVSGEDSLMEKFHQFLF